VVERQGSAWGAPRLVAVLSADDGSDWGASGGGPGEQTARVSPNGRWLTFMSDRSLTGYDNRDAASGKPDEEVYLYHQGTGLTCASCNPTGARPEGYEIGNNARLNDSQGIWPSSAWVAANVPGWTGFNVAYARYQSRYLSDSGRLFFNSSDALVPQDVNGTGDVYEYEPPGIGNCTSASVTFSERSGGCVDLISSGRSPEESGFLDASENGGDVFFLTSAKLSPKDVDTSIDVYDAHECSGASPCPSEPVTPPTCSTGDSCKPAPTPQPEIFGAPASATFSGPGNLLAEPPPAPPKPTAAQLRAKALAVALKGCRKRYLHSKNRRGACERAAHKRYGPPAKKATARKSTRKGHR